MTPALVAAVTALALLFAHVQRPTFSAGSHGVVVPVAVFDGDQVVRKLTAEDFIVRDNGVLQTIGSADFNTLPIDLRLVFDTSGSISDEDFASFLRTMRQVTATLEPRDRCEILTFNARIHEAAARQSPPIKIDLVRGGLNRTAFFDAVTLSLATAPSADRRQITIILSDAKDNSSFFDEATLLEAARITDAVVYTILPGDPKFSRAVSVSRLQALSILTGGRLVRAPQRAVDDVINDAIREFRESYVVRYTIPAATLPGWHKLDVKVRNENYRIRARAGYFGR